MGKGSEISKNKIPCYVVEFDSGIFVNTLPIRVAVVCVASLHSSLLSTLCYLPLCSFLFSSLRFTTLRVPLLNSFLRPSVPSPLRFPLPLTQPKPVRLFAVIILVQVKGDIDEFTFDFQFGFDCRVSIPAFRPLFASNSLLLPFALPPCRPPLFASLHC